MGLLKTFMVLMGMVVGTVVFAFSTFATKEQVKEQITDRLDRIELKLDKVLEQEK